ncbi:MAG: hypothetical protein MUC96_20820 [Myxococcaceae bacterium]|nr:hypothetical protein [Myxococcaceae bacterium]
MRWSEGKRQATPSAVRHNAPDGLMHLDGASVVADVKDSLRADRFTEAFNAGGLKGLLGGFVDMVTPGKQIEAAGVVNVGERTLLLELANFTSAPDAVIQEATKGLGSRADFEKTFSEKERAHFIQNFPTVGRSQATALHHQPSEKRDFDASDRFKTLNLGGLSSKVLKDWKKADPAVKATVDELIKAAADTYGGSAAELAKTATVVRVGNVHEDYGYAVLLEGPVSRRPDGMPDGTYSHHTAAVISPEGALLGEPVGSLWKHS